jgi:hypothetical protein
MSPGAVLNVAVPPPRNPMEAFNLEDFSFPFDPTVFFASETDGADPEMEEPAPAVQPHQV